MLPFLFEPEDAKRPPDPGLIKIKEKTSSVFFSFIHQSPKLNRGSSSFPPPASLTFYPPPVGGGDSETPLYHSALNHSPPVGGSGSGTGFSKSDALCLLIGHQLRCLIEVRDLLKDTRILKFSPITPAQLRSYHPPTLKLRWIDGC